MEKKKVLRWLILLIIVLLAAAIFKGKQRGEMMVYYSSTATMGNFHVERLIIVANQRKIWDKQEYAEKIVEKCRENGFQNMRLSYDRSKPNELEISVCLNEKQAEKGEAEFRFRYVQEEVDGIYNIIDHPEKFYVQILSGD